MKTALIILAIFLVPWLSQRYHITDAGASGTPNSVETKGTAPDSLGSVRIINASGLKQLPAVVKDLSLVLNEPPLKEGLFLNRNGFAVHLYDVTCKNTENPAAIRYQVNDTIYHLKLNRFNRQAGDKALAATLIHEIMHCVLLDLLKRAKQDDQQAIGNIAHIGSDKDEFFTLMNSGDSGQHELIHRFFYGYTVSLIKRFAETHGEPFTDNKDAELLMWSGLQKTTAYKNLSKKEKRKIESMILHEKGLTED